MPKDLAGKKVITVGSFYNDTTSVEQQIREAVEDGKTMTMEQAKKIYNTFNKYWFSSYWRKVS